VRRLLDLGVSPDDAAFAAGLRRMLNAVLLFGILPNVPLSIFGLRPGVPPLFLAVVSVHVGVLVALLVAQHRRVRTETVASLGILWTLFYLVSLESQVGGWQGGTGLVAWGLVIFGHVMLSETQGWLKRLSLGSAWICAAGLWVVDAQMSGLATGPLVMRFAALVAFPLIVLVVLRAYRKESEAVLSEAVAQGVELEELLRMAELGHIASGVSHALAHPLQLATARLDLVTELGSDPGSTEVDREQLLAARDALSDLARVVRQLDAYTDVSREMETNQSNLAECLEEVRVLTLARVRHTNLTVDRSGIDEDVSLPVDRYSGTRMVTTMLTCGTRFLREASHLKPLMRLASERRGDQTVVSMRLGSPAAGSDRALGPELVTRVDEGPCAPILRLCRDKGWSCAYEYSRNHGIVEIGLPATGVSSETGTTS
jgi:hypothetical protein